MRTRNALSRLQHVGAKPWVDALFALHCAIDNLQTSLSARDGECKRTTRALLHPRLRRRHGGHRG